MSNAASLVYRAWKIYSFTSKDDLVLGPCGRKTAVNAVHKRGPQPNRLANNAPSHAP